MITIETQNEHVKNLRIDDDHGNEQSIILEFKSGHQLELYLTDFGIDINHWVPNKEKDVLTLKFRIAEIGYEKLGIEECEDLSSLAEDKDVLVVQTPENVRHLFVEKLRN